MIADSQSDPSAAPAPAGPIWTIAAAEVPARVLTMALLALALALGAWLRFAAIGANEMSADEGASSVQSTEAFARAPSRLKRRR